jgi:sugar lactone lactonase YvrE
MNDRARATLADLLRRYGPSLREDPRRTEALLRDLCGDDRREISVILGAMRERVPNDLLGSQHGVPKGILISRLVKRLEDNQGLSPPAARWAVESWALALGVVSAAELTPPSPEPEPAEPSAKRRAAEPGPSSARAAPSATATPKVVSEVQALLRAGKMVEAVQAFRDATGASLAESKRAVEAIAAKLQSQRSAPGVAPDRFGQVTTLAGNGRKGFQDGPGQSAQFAKPGGITVGPDGTLYVADTGNRRLRAIAADGSVSTLGGTGRMLDFSDDGPLDRASFMQPISVGADRQGTLYVAEGLSGVRVVRLATRQVTTIQGVEFGTLGGLAVAPDGTVYLTDSSRLARVVPTGLGRFNVTKLGLKGDGFAPRDGPVAQAQFLNPSGLAVDAQGNVYIADTDNHRIRKLDTSDIVTTVAGSPNFFQMGGYVDGAGDKARFNAPSGVTVDAAGRIFVADSGNHRIRRIDPNGTVSTVAGSGDKGYADGPAATARFHTPVDLALGRDGTLYVLDKGNHCVRAIRP